MSQRFNRSQRVMQPLERRVLLSSYLVDTTSDSAADAAGTKDGKVSLREAIVAANTNAAFGDAKAGSSDGDVIRFADALKEKAVTLTNGQFSITDDLTIDGPAGDVFLDGGDDSRIFHVNTGQKVALFDLTLSNGDAADNGGALLLTGGGQTHLERVTIQTSVARGAAATQGGGGIYNDDHDLTLKQVDLLDNAATGAAGSGGGMFTKSGDVKIYDSFIAGNVANRAGGGIEIIDGDLLLNDVSLGGPNGADGNVAGPSGSASPGNGGGLHVTGAARVVIEHSDVTNNFAAKEGGGLWNAANSTMIVTHSTIADNDAAGAAADDGGGGIFNNGGKLYVSHSVIKGNVASGTAGSGGGIFSTAGEVVVRHTRLTGNVANRAGGGVELIAGTVALKHSKLEKNVAGPAGSASPGNGGALHVTGPGATVYVHGSTVRHNVAAREGGGLWNAAASTMDVCGSSIWSNTASGPAADDGGGGIFNNGGTLNVSYSLVADNLANGAAGSGGGIFSTAGDVHVHRSEIDGNVANRAGGGVEIINGNFTLERVELDDNVTGPAGSANPGNGGGLHVSGNSAVVNVLKSAVEDNSAAREGGGLWNQAGSTMNVVGSYIARNYAAGNAADDGGGGIFNNGGVLNVSWSKIEKNAATGDNGAGGGLHLAPGGKVRIEDSSIERNFARGNGGGIFNDAALVLEDTRVHKNQAGASGGGIFTDAGATTELEDASVTRNSPDNFAGLGMVG
ncbi:MAG TPA: hypothetical protein VER17_14995 [Tepidisphaeraceae bacterium]|nr:hypothetical protein [Tepidisphaeraceae bacterium]